MLLVKGQMVEGRLEMDLLIMMEMPKLLKQAED